MPEVIPEQVRIKIKEMVLAGEIDTEIREIDGYWGIRADSGWFYVYMGDGKWCQYIIPEKVRVLHEYSTERVLRNIKILCGEWL